MLTSMDIKMTKEQFNANSALVYQYITYERYLRYSHMT